MLHHKKKFSVHCLSSHECSNGIHNDIYGRIFFQTSSKSYSVVDTEITPVVDLKVNSSHSYHSGVTKYCFFFISMVHKSLAQMYYISMKICIGNCSNFSSMSVYLCIQNILVFSDFFLMNFKVMI